MDVPPLPLPDEPFVSKWRIFFGLEKGGDTCTGLLSFYCRKAAAKESPKVYLAVNEVLEEVAAEVRGMIDRKAANWETE